MRVALRVVEHRRAVLAEYDVWRATSAHCRIDQNNDIAMPQPLRDAQQVSARINHFDIIGKIAALDECARDLRTDRIGRQFCIAQGNNQSALHSATSSSDTGAETQAGKRRVKVVPEPT